MTFRHGVTTTETEAGTVEIEEGATNVIFLVGTAPIHQVDSSIRPAVNALTLITSDAGYAKFGPDIAGYSIPEALKAHALLGKGLVVVVNVFDPTASAHKTTVAEATIAKTADNQIQLPHGDIISATVKHIATPDVAGVEGTDYTIDRLTGLIEFLADGILDGDASAKVTYAYGNPGGVVSADVIGDDDGSGVRSGLQAALNVENSFGFLPKIFIAPRFSSALTVMNALGAMAQKCRGVAGADAPPGTTPDDAIAGRTPGETPDLSCAHPRVRICVPHLKRDDGRIVPMSPYWAALRAWSDTVRGFWWSASNVVIPGVAGLELAITASFTDPNADTTRLNAAGLTTAFVKNGLGTRLWGNRMASFPSDSSIGSFECSVVTRDVIEAAIEFYAALRRVDSPTNQALIDGTTADVNEFFNGLIGDGASMPGSVCWVDPADNPTGNLASGKIKWRYKFCNPPPAEDMEFESIRDTTLLGSVFA